jgi:hypothetical protein
MKDKDYKCFACGTSRLKYKTYTFYEVLRGNKPYVVYGFVPGMRIEMWSKHDCQRVFSAWLECPSCHFIWGYCGGWGKPPRETEEKLLQQWREYRDAIRELAEQGERRARAAKD